MPEASFYDPSEGDDPNVMFGAHGTTGAAVNDLTAKVFYTPIGSNTEEQRDGAVTYDAPIGVLRHFHVSFAAGSVSKVDSARITVYRNNVAQNTVGLLTLINRPGSDGAAIVAMEAMRNAGFVVGNGLMLVPTNPPMLIGQHVAGGVKVIILVSEVTSPNNILKVLYPTVSMGYWYTLFSPPVGSDSPHGLRVLTLNAADEVIDAIGHII
jgi:hypothetical protein